MFQHTVHMQICNLLLYSSTIEQQDLGTYILFKTLKAFDLVNLKSFTKDINDMPPQESKSYVLNILPHKFFFFSK